jgi:hypothetical protein
MPKQPVVLAIVVAVSGIALYAMRAFTLSSRFDFQAREVNYDGEASRAQSSMYARVMGDLARIEKPLSVDLTGVSRTPFRFVGDGELAPEVTTTMGQIDNPDLIAAKEKRREKAVLTAKLGKLEVQSVMSGRRPLARINNETYQVGDVVSETFTVTAIEGRSVTLRASDWQWQLSMEESTSSNKRKNASKSNH